MKRLLWLCLFVLVGCQSRTAEQQTTKNTTTETTSIQQETTQSSETTKVVETRMNLQELVVENYTSVAGMWGNTEVTNLKQNPVREDKLELIYDSFLVNEAGGINWEGKPGTDVFHIKSGYSEIKDDMILTSAGRPDGARDVHSVIFIPAGVESKDLAHNGDVTKDRIVINFSYDVGVFSRIFYRVK